MLGIEMMIYGDCVLVTSKRKKIEEERRGWKVEEKCVVKKYVIKSFLF